MKSPTQSPATNPLLEVKGLNVAFDTDRGQIRPVRDVSLSIYPGQTVALVGESGCGKSVTALSILRLIPSPPGQGPGRADPARGPRPAGADRAARCAGVRGKDIAMIFQEPMTSLNPVYTIGDQIVEAVTLHQDVSHARGVPRSPSRRCATSASPTRTAGSTNTRTRCPAACGSA